MINRVLQMNVRLSEGGAAGVATTLAAELETQGIHSPFAYGYGPHGRRSPLAGHIDSHRLTPAPIAALNQASYSLLGKETGLVASKAGRDLSAQLASSDIIHLHVIHSYMMSTERLFQLLIRAGKPVVWTLHDQWAMTGRCAQPGACELWESGCSKCPDKAAYPPAILDFASRRFAERRESIARLQQELPTAIVACADWLATEAEKSSLKNISVIKNSVDREFWETVRTRPTGERDLKSSNLFICRDLRDPNKVDWDFLRRVSEIPGQKLTVIGDNPPSDLPQAELLSSISDRAQMASHYLRHSRLIFTSTVDYFPLTIVEALAGGLEVFAIRSRASEEFETNQTVHIFESLRDLELALSVGDISPSVPLGSGEDSSLYDPRRMAAEYLALYDRLKLEML